MLYMMKEWADDQKMYSLSLPLYCFQANLPGLWLEFLRTPGQLHAMTLTKPPTLSPVNSFLNSLPPSR